MGGLLRPIRRRTLMGRSRRPRPAQLAVKLRQLRSALGLTQEQMFERLGETNTALYPGHISLYESGQREPPLPVLLSYARSAGVYVDVLIDDELNLPDRLPVRPSSIDNLKRFKKSEVHKSSSKRPQFSGHIQVPIAAFSGHTFFHNYPY